jgi:hypothetical protein
VKHYLVIQDKLVNQIFEINHLMCSLISYDLPSHYYIKRHLLDYVFGNIIYDHIPLLRL